MQFSTTLITLVLAVVASAAPLAQSDNNAAPFRAQNGSGDTVLPEREQPQDNVDNRNFVFHIPAWAEGKTCFPFLASNHNQDERGQVQVATLQPDRALKNQVTVFNVAEQAIDQVVGTFGLQKIDEYPTVQTSGAFEFPCVGGSTVALRLTANGFFNIYNTSGRFRIHVV